MDDEDWLENLEAVDEAAASQSKKKRGSKKDKKESAVEKRMDAFGNTVRYSASANQKIRDRIFRALPGTFQLPLVHGLS